MKSLQDVALKGFSLQDLADTVNANEPLINNDAVIKVFEEMLLETARNARSEIYGRMDEIIEASKNHSDEEIKIASYEQAEHIKSFEVLSKRERDNVSEIMLNSYLETILFAECDLGDDEDMPESFLSNNWDADDFSSEAVKQAKSDLSDFIELAGDLLEGLDDGQVGHDFWLTRQGHGAGFWDGDYEKTIGEKLTEISKTFGTADLYTKDDEIFFS